MKRPSIKIALTGALGLIAIAMIGFSAVAISSLGTLNANSEMLAYKILPQISLSKEMKETLSDLRRAYLNHIVALDDEMHAAATKSVADEQAGFLAEMAKYATTVDTEAERAFLSDIETKFTAVTGVGKSVIELSAAGKRGDAVKMQQLKLKPLATEISEVLNKLAQENDDEALAASATNSADFFSTMFWIIAILAICLTVLGGAIYFALTGIARPIEKITASMLGLAKGSTSDAIPYQGRADEIGSMAAAVEVFRANAVANQRLEAEAVAQNAAGEQQRQRVQAIDQQRAAEMRAVTEGLGDGLKNLAAGNLGFRLNKAFAADFEGLRGDFNASVTQLTETLQEVATSASSIDDGSREIAEGAGDLSRRTENQAASLEETAAALDQISANVSSSSKLTEKARSVAVNANASAAKSSSVVADAVAAMGRIEESSGRIVSIISVIDEIAFQTNLLALNAGVEAARAGEAGRGFAVVAQEVRELAQRSAKAAKEIKQLISVSTQEVKGGVELVRETGKSLDTIAQQIVIINQHMNSIATSYKEQSVGLSEVNIAVNQMDQVTQQNAAMVEETTAASATLSHEASRLRELLQRFELRVGNTKGGMPRAA